MRISYLDVRSEVVCVQRSKNDFPSYLLQILSFEFDNCFYLLEYYKSVYNFWSLNVEGQVENVASIGTPEPPDTLL